MNIKKLILNLILNIFLLSFLTIAIQNSNNKKSINLIFFQTISLPLSFILGSGFVIGSLCGGFIQSFEFQKDKS